MNTIEQLQSKIESQAREIERLSTKLRTALLDSAELAALKAQPLGAVLPPHANTGAAIQGILQAIGIDGDVSYHLAGQVWNACLDEVARLNQRPASGGERNPVNHKYLMGAIEQLASIEKSQNARESRMAATPASGGDDAERADVASDAWLEKWAADKFTAYGQYKGRVYGNTDWALARSLHTAICAALPVREAVAEGWQLVPAEPSAEMEEAGCQGYMHADGNAWVMHKSSMGHAYKAMLAAAPSPSREGE